MFFSFPIIFIHCSLLLPTYIPFYNVRQTVCKSNAAQMTIQQFFLSATAWNIYPFYGFKKKKLATLTISIWRLNLLYVLLVLSQKSSIHLFIWICFPWLEPPLIFSDIAMLISFSAAHQIFVPPKNRDLEEQLSCTSWLFSTAVFLLRMQDFEGSLPRLPPHPLI